MAAFLGSNKKKKYMGENKFAFDQANQEAHLWCFRNKIFITPVETGFRHRLWKLEISINGRIYTSPEAYGPTDVWEKMYEYYNYYYKKYEK